MNYADVIIEDERWNVYSGDIEHVIKAIREHLRIDDENTFCSIMMTDDAEIQKLNADFRHKDKATNVLSFPCEDLDEYIGDMVIAYETVLRESQEQSKSFDSHATHMIVHGFLHLLGFDHIEDDEAEIMEAHEIKILSALNISNPYDTIMT